MEKPGLSSRQAARKGFFHGLQKRRSFPSFRVARRMLISRLEVRQGMSAVLPALERDVDTKPAAVYLEVVCYRPGTRPFPGFEARLRQVVAELGHRARLVFAAATAGRPPIPAGAFLSPTVPTVIAMADGRLLAQAVGDLPRRELRALMATALVCCRPG
jgi:hypothetical protein